jgi:hypothetical protein
MNEETLERCIEKLPIRIMQYDITDLHELAVKHYMKSTGKEIKSTYKYDSYQSFVNRICVNFLRHESTPYDMVVHTMKYAELRDYAKLLISNRVFAEISRVYPELQEECIRQMQQRMPKELCES